MVAPARRNDPGGGGRDKMENFVLNLFTDQLSKIILDFHRTEISKCPFH